jgi:glyoxylase-like metal-dependent hydrolase (beta-lactamase superfamily II)
MISRVFKNIYCLKIPLPDSPLKAVNVYVIRAQPRSLIIDSGLNREVCETAFHCCLSKLNLDLKQVDFFITHFHADHSGLLSRLNLTDSVVYMSKTDADNYRNTQYWSSVSAAAQLNGFPEDRIHKAITDHPGNKYRTPSNLDYTMVSEGSRLRAGEFEFICIETPGHTSGHLCLYEPKQAILLSGDLILDRITPTIQTWRKDDNPLHDYQSSLKKILNLTIKLFLPGHGLAIKNVKTRISDINSHHDDRCREIVTLLAGCELSAYYIASKLGWNTAWPDWNRFPYWHQLLATGETLAHLNYLCHQEVVTYCEKDGHFYFHLN